MNLSADASVALDYAAPTVAGWDEARTDDGGLREEWRYVLEGLRDLGASELDERTEKLRHILRDEGATYNIYREQPASQTWQLDPVPMIVGSDEWSRIESGLRERAELLNLVLADIYGPRELMRHGVIPPALVLCHPGYLRSCHDIRLPGDQQLVFHSADLVRGTDGQWSVLADRSQAPSGVGYALENRNVLQRVFPSLFRDSHVHRLSLFFLRLRTALTAVAPTTERPNIVVMTPGSLNETWFEHAYLANYLGYPLVQGNDLVVREGRVWMKTLSGLSRVDVILRRVDDSYCDPVELKSDSQLGVPGLLHAARSGRVSVVNPMGAGVLENAGLLKYLPAAARHFLGRDLRLDSVPTWWCGDSADLAYVKEHLPQLVLKNTHRGANHVRVFGHDLSEVELDFWRSEIDRYPQRFAAQAWVEPSRSPVWQDHTLSARPTIMRSFAVASEGSYTLLPGGLTRVGQNEGSRLVASQFGSLSKDTWVLASEPEKQVTLGTSKTPEPVVSDTSIDLPSRVVENIFWMGRYAERTESSLRYLRTVFIQLNNRDQLPDSALQLLLRAVTSLTSSWPGFTTGDAAVWSAPEAELLDVILDAERSGSVAECIESMLRSAYQVRNHLSLDTQRIINNVRDQLDELRKTFGDEIASAPEEELVPIVTSMLALAGLFHESMVHGTGWSFMEIGRRLERGLQTGMLIRSLLVEAPADAPPQTVLGPLLSSLESIMTYQRRNHGRYDVARALELLLLDRNNPRSLIYQLDVLDTIIKRLPDSSSPGVPSRQARLLIDAMATLQLSDLEKLAMVSKQGQKRDALDQMLVRMDHLLQETSRTLSALYFEKIQPPSSFGFTRGDEML